MNNKIKKTLAEIFSVVLELSENTDFVSLRRITEENWDSLAHASIISGIESEFKIELSLADYDRLSSFSSALLIIKEKHQ
ncbi:MAG: acyl carrier protein [Nitrospina sp.]|jgi:acyl carrier protein|nr:acyl carrier protein [Nitrospina sp.]